MSEDTHDAVVLTDEDGNYFVLPRELIELTKVELDAVSSLKEHLQEVVGYGRELRFAMMGRTKRRFELVGRVSKAQQRVRFNPTVAWPYYRLGPRGDERVNPAGR